MMDRAWYMPPATLMFMPKTPADDTSTSLALGVLFVFQTLDIYLIKIIQNLEICIH